MASKPADRLPPPFVTDDLATAGELLHAEIEGIEYRVEQELALLRALDSHRMQYARILNILLPIREEQIRLREQLERLVNVIAGTGA